MSGSWSIPRVRCSSAARPWILAMTCRKAASKSPTQTPPRIAPAAKASPRNPAKDPPIADYADDSDITKGAWRGELLRAQRRNVVGQAFLPATASGNACPAEKGPVNGAAHVHLNLRLP